MLIQFSLKAPNLQEHWLGMASLTDTTSVWLDSSVLINRGNDFFHEAKIVIQ